MSGDPAERAWGWLAHLVAGGTTPWLAWSGRAPVSGLALPGALQLELLRRVNLVGRPDSAAVDRILRASSASREVVERPLVGLAHDLRFGFLPVDPATLPEGDLLRLAAAALAEWVALEPVAPLVPPPLPRPWRPAYRLTGDPWLTATVGEQLTRRGSPPGGPAARRLVLGTELDTMLVHGWVTNVIDRTPRGWASWLGDWAARDGTPPRVDLALAARRAAERVGRDRVRVVLDLRAVGRALWQRRLPPPPEPPPADAVELVRRVARPLSAVVPPAERAGRLRSLLGWLAAEEGEPLRVPDTLTDWTRDRAARMAAELRAAGYPVDGNLDRLTRRGAPGSVPTDRGALRIGLNLLATGGRLGEGRPGWKEGG